MARTKNTRVGTCPHCKKPDRELRYRIGGIWGCSACYRSKRPKENCSNCKKLKRVDARDGDKPLCETCSKKLGVNKKSSNPKTGRPRKENSKQDVAPQKKRGCDNPHHAKHKTTGKCITCGLLKKKQ